MAESTVQTTDEDFWSTVDKFRSPHLWTQVDGEWKLRHTVMANGVDDK